VTNKKLKAPGFAMLEPVGLRRLLQFFLLLALPAIALASASPNGFQLAARQLFWPLESGTVFINGSPLTASAPARLLEGRAVLPLRELARLLELPLETIPGVPDGVRLGGLEVYPSLRLARLNGKQVELKEVGTVEGGVLYVAARSLEAALGLRVNFDPTQRLLSLTFSPPLAEPQRLPVARFTTDKLEYRLGEPVQVTDYSYDPDGLPVYARWSGREEAYFTPGPKTLTLTVSNSAGRASQPYSVQIQVLDQPYLSPRDYALRYFSVGRTFLDGSVMSYPALTPERQDDPVPLLLSNSPEKALTSGLLYEGTIQGTARLLAYHTNGLSVPARLLLVASNLGSTTQTVRPLRQGSVASTSVVALLGQVSLLDFLTSRPAGRLALEPGQALPLYVSPQLAPGEGLSLKLDLETAGAEPGAVQLSLYLLEEPLLSSFGNLSAPATLEALHALPVLEPDSVHVRGTFLGAVRRLRLDLSGLEPGSARRLVLGDNFLDPALEGRDALSGNAYRLLGNYGVTYLISVENAAGTVGAFVPRGGLYSGAIRANGLYVEVPQSGVLVRGDLPMIFYRNLDGPFLSPRMELEFVPASGSFLPVNLVFYKPALPGSGPTVKR
jgi:hypothetical protein